MRQRRAKINERKSPLQVLPFPPIDAAELGGAGAKQKQKNQHTSHIHQISHIYYGQLKHGPRFTQLGRKSS